MDLRLDVVDDSSEEVDLRLSVVDDSSEDVLLDVLLEVVDLSFDLIPSSRSSHDFSLHWILLMPFGVLSHNEF